MVHGTFSFQNVIFSAKGQINAKKPYENENENEKIWIGLRFTQSKNRISSEKYISVKPLFFLSDNAIWLFFEIAHKIRVEQAH